jgi:hypothetical protein
VKVQVGAKGERSHCHAIESHESKVLRATTNQMLPGRHRHASASHWPAEGGVLM